MKNWFGGPRGGLAAFVIITGLVAGALGWATAAALRVEREQLAERAEAEQSARLRLALWRLDSLVAPLLAREHNRPFDHYSAIFAPPLAFDNLGACRTPGTILEPSPLLGTELPDWMLVHFQITAKGWESPQAPAASLLRRLNDPRIQSALHQANVTPERRALLAELARKLPAAQMLAIARARTEPATLRDTTLMLAQMNQAPWQQTAPAPNPEAPSQGSLAAKQGNPQSNTANINPYSGQLNNDYGMRDNYRSKLQQEQGQLSQRVARDLAVNSSGGNGENYLYPGGKPANAPAPPKDQTKGAKTIHSSEAVVKLSPMVPLWAQTGQGDEQLVLLRLVSIEDKETCQGVVLDAPRLQAVLVEELADLFPEARLVPVREIVTEPSERKMTALPFELDPGPIAPAVEPGWTALRVGLCLAWSAAGIALLAVALGGWSLIDLSERRIRFVSAVTHELRTPLTTLRLYLDMLLGGMVREGQQREEYLQTLNAETERLNRLVGNVLDFSRLEKQQPAMTRAQVRVAELLEQAQGTWQGRCRDAGKELLVENTIDPGTLLCTDAALLQQVLGNLLDNACKYSRGADDARLWLRVRAEQSRVVFEVEDRGPGVQPAERRSIFRAFRRGRHADVTAGGVGLGLALAHRWTRLLGGRLLLRPPGKETGACFQVCLPMLRQGESCS